MDLFSLVRFAFFCGDGGGGGLVWKCEVNSFALNWEGEFSGIHSLKRERERERQRGAAKAEAAAAEAGVKSRKVEKLLMQKAFG